MNKRMKKNYQQPEVRNRMVNIERTVCASSGNPTADTEVWDEVDLSEL